MNSVVSSPLPLADSGSLPLRSPSTIAPGCVLIVAPHPDDETLGCGGTIAMLRSLNYTVKVLVISDGTMSHPQSRKYPPTALRQLREQETLTALNLLGVGEKAVTFLRLADGEVSTLARSPAIRAICQAYLKAVRPTTIFLPWRCDPHADHRGTWQLIHTLVTDLPTIPRLIEYPIWDWDLEQRGAVRNLAKIAGWRMNIQPAMKLKQQAIAAYQSQTTDLIDDDPTAFRLTPEMLANFSYPWELYFEEVR